MFEPIEWLIKKNQLANPSLLLAPQICHEAEEIIEKLIPKSKDKFKIISFRDSRLKISCADSILAHKIRMSEAKIVKRLQKKIKIKPFRIVYTPQE